MDIEASTYAMDEEDSSDESEAPFESSKTRALELMSRAQYQNYFEAPVTDVTSKVQHIHRSAKDFLLETGNLDCLFKNGTDGPALSKNAKPRGNGHTYLLDFCFRYAQVQEESGAHVWRQLRLYWDLQEEVLHHASRADETGALFTYGNLRKIMTT